MKEKIENRFIALYQIFLGLKDLMGWGEEISLNRATDIANTTATRDVAIAEANRITITAQKVKHAKALEDSYKAEENAEKQRAEKDRATQYTNFVVPAEIDKQKIIVNADANAEESRRVAQGKADAKFAMMEAEAKGINEILTKQAEGFERLVQAAGGSSEKAVQLMIADKFDKLLQIQVDAIKNVKFDKITVWDNGGNGDGKTSTGNFAQGLLGMLPPMGDLFKQVGSEMPDFLQGAGEKVAKELEAKKNATKED